MGEIEELKARLRKGEQSFFDKFSARITYVERLRPIFGFVAVGGAMVAAIARFIPGPWGLGLVVTGAVVAAAGGGFVVLMDFKKLEISQEGRDAHKTADDAIEALAAKTAELEAAEDRVKQTAAFDRKRLARIEATRLMIESVEAAFLKQADVPKSAQQMLERAISNLRTAVDYQAGDFLTFTIFQKTGSGAQEQMTPIAREWTDERDALRLGRSWKRGRGYTGHLWSLARDNPFASVVEPDTRKREAQERYKVDKPDAARESRYRSVASFPILIGADNEIWGVVTATSDRVGVFDRSGDLPHQGVETVRDVAMVASLLAKLSAP
ncbi:hypothetical protein [Brevundimonas fluminis]|uniref:hypothetical protein n=1 Tax=Brevundimonas fluminis TaxID=2487274 RepID=UPI000F658345|nr:hypothetical protein [Brevundimonas fluminis]